MVNRLSIYHLCETEGVCVYIYIYIYIYMNPAESTKITKILPPFARSLFSQSDSSFEKLKMTLLGSSMEMLDLTKLLNYFCWIALFDARMLLLLFRSNELR